MVPPRKNEESKSELTKLKKNIAREEILASGSRRRLSGSGFSTISPVASLGEFTELWNRQIETLAELPNTESKADQDEKDKAGPNVLRQVKYPSQICIHGKVRGTCVDCGGQRICIHGRQKAQCRDCKRNGVPGAGSQICEHDKRRSVCKICKGSQICKHGKRKTACGVCKMEQYCFPVVAQTEPHAQVALAPHGAGVNERESEDGAADNRKGKVKQRHVPSSGWTP